MLVLSTLIYSCLSLAESLVSDNNKFNSLGYRVTHYRGPIDTPPVGAKHITTLELHALLSHEDVVPINVMPLPWLQGQFVLTVKAEHIPGTLWLPNIGYGDLPFKWQVYMERSLSSIGEISDMPAFVFYCKVNCWHGWNAAKRASALGYNHVYWYGGGIDAWLEAQLPTSICEPVRLEYSDTVAELAVCPK